MVENDKKKKITMLLITIEFFFCIVIYCMKIREIIYRADYQWEVREGVGLLIAKRFAEGVNPYVFRDGLPEAVYMYGFVMPMILGGFIKLGVSNIFLFAQFFTIGIEIIGIIVFGILLKRSNINWGLIPIGLLAISSCYYRISAFSGVFPDTLGLTVMLFIWLLVQSNEKRGKHHILIYVILCILEFYIKQYFVFVAIGLMCFCVLKKECKTVVSFFILGILGGLGSIFFVRIIFPVYFTQNTYFLGVYNVYSFTLAITQLISIFKIYNLLFFAIILGIIVALNKKQFKPSDNLYMVSQIITMMVLSFFLSTSNGAWITYYLQLLMPYVIYGAVYMLNNVIENTRGGTDVYVLRLNLYS